MDLLHYIAVRIIPSKEVDLSIGHTYWICIPILKLITRG